MFWKAIRWGGTLIVILLVVAAALLGSHSEETGTVVQPADAPQAAKNFNL